MKYDLTTGQKEAKGFYEWNKKNFLIKSTDERFKDYSQFKKENGFSPDETWSLDTSICLFVLPRLKYFRENTCGFPLDFHNLESWTEVLDKMIHAFELILEDDETKMTNKDIEEGLQLFAKYFCDLWF